MKKILCFIIIILFVVMFLHHEFALAVETKNDIDRINSEIFVNYQKFENTIDNVHSNLLIMQDFFKSDPSMIPEIYNKYYSVLDSVSNGMIKLEKYGLQLQNLCNDLGDYPNEVCFVYSGNILEVKENIQSVVIKFNNVILRYNDFSLSNYEIFR